MDYDEEPCQDASNTLNEASNQLPTASLEPKTSVLPASSTPSSTSDLPLRSFSTDRIEHTDAGSPVTGKRKRFELGLTPSKKARWSGGTLVSQQPRSQSDSEQSAEQEEEFPFPGIWKALLGHHDLLLKITTGYMSPYELLDLYAIDKNFHFLVNANLTSYIKLSARRWAPLSLPQDPQAAKTEEDGEVINAMIIFPSSFYRQYCVRDPAERDMSLPSTPGAAGAAGAASAAMSDIILQITRFGATDMAAPRPRLMLPLRGLHQKNGDASDSRAPTVRLIPGFRYLFFLISRIRTIRSILRTLGWDHDIHCPVYMASTLAKMWVLMDTPTTGARISLVQNRKVWTSADLYRATLFSIKLDMAFSHPIAGDGCAALRELMWAQRSLKVLDRILLRKFGRTDAECFSMCARWKPIQGSEHLPPHLRGFLEREGWGDTWKIVDGAWTRINAPFQSQNRQILLRPDELVMDESIRRRMGLHKHYANMLRSGYFDPKTLRMIRYKWPPSWWLERPGAAAATWIRGSEPPQLRYDNIPLRRNGLNQFEGQVEPPDGPICWDEDDDGDGLNMGELADADSYGRKNFDPDEVEMV